MSLNVDLTPLFAGVNMWLPIALGIVAIPTGIAFAFAIGEWISNKLIGAVRGGKK